MKKILAATLALSVFATAGVANAQTWRGGDSRYEQSPGYDRGDRYDRYDRYDDRYRYDDPRYGYGYDYNRYGNSRSAIRQCVNAVERGSRRYGRTDVTEVTDIDRKRDGYRVKGRVVVRDGYGGRWGRGGYYDRGKFSCDVRYGRIRDIDFSGLR